MLLIMTFHCVSDDVCGGVNFDDGDYGYKEEEKASHKVDQSHAT